MKHKVKTIELNLITDDGLYQVEHETYCTTISHDEIGSKPTRITIPMEAIPEIIAMLERYKEVQP